MARTGLLGSLRQLLAHGLELAQVRLELLLTELEEEKNRLLKLAAFGAAGVLLLVAGVIFLAIFLTVLLWDEHRLLVLGLCTASLLGSGALAMKLALGFAHGGDKPLAASREELAKDQAALRQTP